MSRATANSVSSQQPPDDPGGHLAGGGDPAHLFVRWQRDGDQAAREALVRRFMPLARALARRYGGSSEPLEDLVQVASVGLIKAIDRFDAERGHHFSSFAVPTILGEMRRYFRDSGWSVHVPRGAQERALKVREARDALAPGHAPTVEQLADYLELSIDEVVDALVALQAYEAFSLDAPRSGPSEDDPISVGESLGSEDERYELVELDATLGSALKHLAPRERAMLGMRFVEELTQTEIAQRLGISQMQVSRLLRRSLDQLRTLAPAPADAG